MTNCLNCGAPFDQALEKCPYCGTSYYDMSALTIDGQTPFMLKLKIPYGDNCLYITQLVVASPNSITISEDSEKVYNKEGHCINSFTKNKTVTTDIIFNAVARKNGTMFITQLKET